MSTQILDDPIAGLEHELKQAEADYKDAIEKLAGGEIIPPDELLAVIRAAGKNRDELRDDLALTRAKCATSKRVTKRERLAGEPLAAACGATPCGTTA